MRVGTKSARDGLRFLLAIATTLALACSAPAELVVVVDAAPGSPELESASVWIDDGGAQPSRPGTNAPWTLGVNGRGGQQVHVRVQGTFVGDEQPVRADVRVRLVAGERRVVHVAIGQACAGVVCDDPQSSTCDAETARCVCQERETCLYTQLNGQIPVCGAPFETGCRAEDGGPDAAPDAGDAALDGGPLRDDRFVSLGVGARHSCGVLENAQVACWGSNDHGELGADGPPRASAVRLSTLRASAVGAGRHFSCALTQTGGVECWGDNSRGQLADPDVSRTARGVVLLAAADELAVGGAHVCARLGAEVHCWGDDEHGQVSGASGGSVTAATMFALDFDAEGITAGERHTCAWGAQGAVRCWGDDSASQSLGGATTTVGDEVLELSAGGAHTCALARFGGNDEVRCWGDNSVHQAGPSGLTELVAPTDVGLGGSSELSAGADATCAIVDDVRHCWGHNDGGALGVVAGEVDSVDTPSPSLSDDPVSELRMGDGFGCEIAAGRARCWGWNLAGAVGSGDTIVHQAPTPLETLGVPRMREVALGGDFACGLLRGGDELYCWGAGARGQLGIGARVRARSRPVLVDDTRSGWERLTAGGAHACAIAGASPSLLCWGANEHGQAGPAADTLEPVEALAINSPQPLSAGDAHTCVVSEMDNTQVLCWGLADDGRTGARTDGPTPGPVSLGDRVADLDLGRDHSCAAVELTDGARGVRCWGDFGFGGGQSSVPLPLFDPDIARPWFVAGGGFTCRDAEDKVECVGVNGLGQLGSNITSNPASSPPTHSLMLNASVLRQLDAGGAHACAVTSTSSGAFDVWCWGGNQYGQRGHTQGLGASRVTSAPLEDQPVVALGERSSCYLRPSGQLFCWGSDEDGRLGLGRELVIAEPALVVFE